MKMVVAVDGSPSSRRALEWCARHAGALDGEVVAVHAVEIPVYASSGAPYVPLAPLSDEDRERLRDVVDRDWCSALHDSGVDVRVVVADGTAATVVMKVGDDEGADLVVTGRRGLSGFKELLLGSTSHQLSHHLDRPILIVP
jgi:nucleotide-binding universal stress UspA family protein